MLLLTISSTPRDSRSTAMQDRDAFNGAFDRATRDGQSQADAMTFASDWLDTCQTRRGWDAAA